MAAITISAREKSFLAQQREADIKYVETHVAPTYPTENTTLTARTSVLPKLDENLRQLVLEAFNGVGAGVSKKGIFFGAAGLYYTKHGTLATDFGFNVDTDAGDTFCAERVLLGRLTRASDFGRLKAIALVANLFSEVEQGHEGPRAPCHACREQYRRALNDPSIQVIMSSSTMNDIVISQMGNLLPLSYLTGRQFDPQEVRDQRIPTLRVFRRGDLVYRSKHNDPIASQILSVSDAARKALSSGQKAKARFNLEGTVTGVAALVSKDIKIGDTTSSEELLLSAFSPSLSGKSAVRDLMTELQRTCGIHGRVKIVGVHGQGEDFTAGVTAPSAGARQAVYDRVFFQNRNALFVLTNTASDDFVITVDARHLLPLGKPVMDYIDLNKHATLADGLKGR